MERLNALIGDVVTYEAEDSQPHLGKLPEVDVRNLLDSHVLPVFKLSLKVDSQVSASQYGTKLSRTTGHVVEER